MTPPLIMIAAGGTAGHVVPALAVADALQAERARVIFVGGRRAEAELVPAAGYELQTIVVEPLYRRAPVKAARAVFVDALALRSARRMLRDLRPAAVMGAGGYVSGPVGLAAVLTRVPLVLTEADSHVGVSNRVLAPFADRVCLAFPIPGKADAPDPAEPDSDAPGGGKADARSRHGRYLVTGRPVPPPATDRAAARARFGIGADETCVLVFGGSLGARSINHAAIEAFAGARFRERACYDEAKRFGEALIAADIVVSRAGGSIFEIAAAGRPAVLIPYPYATGNHQTANARYMEQAGAAVVIPDAELTPARLAQEVGGLLADVSRLRAMARASSALARPDAAREIARVVLEAAGRA